MTSWRDRRFANAPERDRKRVRLMSRGDVRKNALERVLARRPEGVFVNPFKRGEIGPNPSAPPAAWGWRGLSPSIGTKNTAEHRVTSARTWVAAHPR